MELQGARVLVAGSTGALGSRAQAALEARGARVHGASRATGLDVADAASCSAAVQQAAAALGGLDALVIATGAVAFGPAADLEDAVAAQLFAVNALGPIALVRAALPRIGRGGAVAALSAIVADHPTAGMAAYSASKAALSAYLSAVRREARRQGVAILDVRPPHLDTPFAAKALSGEPPKLPDPFPADDLIAALVGALADGKREIGWDLRERRLVVN